MSNAPVETVTVNRVFSVPQTAELLNIGSRTVWRMIANGEIKAIRPTRRRTGILASEIARLQQTAA